MDEVVYLYLDDIIPNRFQPREVFDERALKELALSIREHGVIQPIIVRKIGTKYEIIAGERRYKASTLAGLTKIPAIVRNLDDKESSKVALIENLQRKDLTPIEEARTYQKILDIDNITQEELAKSMGKSQSAVSNKLRLLTLSNKIQEALLNEKISERHARSLLNVPDEKERERLTELIVEKRLSVKDLESIIKNKEIAEETQEKEEVKEEINLNSVEEKNNKQQKNDEYPRINFEDLLKNLKKDDPIIEEEIETLDIQETDDNYFSFDGFTDINNNSFSNSIDKLRATVNEIKKLGIKIKSDELDLENKHRFIIEIEKDNK
ncbi:MAG: ParB/RepB/Spo0J family partition protein [Bacilli bacterium]|nr:ParB/RepB/Spo0J family partition protein [Bacilli bacterium]